MSLSSLRIRGFQLSASSSRAAGICAALLSFTVPAVLSAQATPAAVTAPAAQTATGTARSATSGIVRGTVTDPDAAIIPGAVISLAPASGAQVLGKSGSDGG